MNIVCCRPSRRHSFQPTVTICVCVAMEMRARSNIPKKIWFYMFYDLFVVYPILFSPWIFTNIYKQHPKNRPLLLVNLPTKTYGMGMVIPQLASWIEPLTHACSRETHWEPNLDYHCHDQTWKTHSKHKIVYYTMIFKVLPPWYLRFYQIVYIHDQ